MAEELSQQHKQALQEAFDEKMETIQEGAAEEVENRLKTYLSDEVADKVKQEYVKMQEKSLGKEIGDEERKQLNKEVESMLRNKEIPGMKEKASMLQTSDEAGGYLVPEPMRAQIDRIADTDGLMLNLAERVSMSSETLKLPSYEKSVLRGEFQDYPNEASETDLTSAFGQTELRNIYWILIFAVPNSLIQDAEFSVMDFLSALAGEGKAYRIDEECIVGGDSSDNPFIGIFNSSIPKSYNLGGSNSSGSTNVSDFTNEDAAKMVAQIETSELGEAAWLFSRDDWATISTLTDSNGQPIFRTETTAYLTFQQKTGLNPVGTLRGYPVYTSDLVPTGGTTNDKKFVAFGNIRKAVKLGIRNSMEMAQSNDATIGGKSQFRNVGTGVRFAQRWGTAVAEAGGKALVIGETANS